MEKQSTVHCKYSKCLHGSREISKDDAVKIGNCYYHLDCLKTKEDIKKIIDLFTKHINPNPVYSNLQKVIDNIVFKKQLGSDFLLFGLKYYIDHKIPLNYPQGLYYVIQNKQVIEAYKKPEIKNIRNKVEIKEETNQSFTHIPIKNNGFADILR